MIRKTKGNGLEMAVGGGILVWVGKHFKFGLKIKGKGYLFVFDFAFWSCIFVTVYILGFCVREKEDNLTCIEFFLFLPCFLVVNLSVFLLSF